MRKLLFVAFLASLAVVMVAAQPAAAAGGVEEAIAAANSEYETLAAGGDATALAAQFTEDALLLIPDMELISGRAAITSSLAQTGVQLADMRLMTARVVATDDLAYELGKWSSTIDGQQTLGNYLTLWRFDGGKWQRAAMCSVPETWPPDLKVDDPSSVFPTAQQAGLRLVGEKTTTEPIAASIQGRLAQYANLVNAGDAKALSDYAGALYTSDAVVMLPETSLLEGSLEIVETCDECVAEAALTNMWFNVTSVEAGSTGDMAFSVASYYNDVKSEKGEMFPSVGNYLSVWVVDDGQWSIAASCTANSSPTPSVEYLVAK